MAAANFLTMQRSDAQKATLLEEIMLWAKFLLCSVEHKRKNWQMIDTINGAKTSAIIYSIVETAKANNLKPFDYVQYLLEEIPKHMSDTNCSFLENLLPWSENLPAGIRKS